MNYLRKNMNKIIFTWLICLTISVIVLHTHTIEPNVHVEPTPTKPTTEVTTEVTTEIVTEIVTEAPTSQVESLGTFKLTAYCACEKCCGKSDVITATGTKATANRTIAVDKTVIPYGTTVVINGIEYVAEDTGGAIKGNIIDIFFDDHDDALKFGVQYADVYKVVN